MVDPKQIERFAKAARKLHAEIAERDAKPDDPNFDTPGTSGQGHMMVNLFVVGCAKIENDEVESIRAIANHYGQSAAGMKAENPFELLLLAFHGANGPVDNSTRSKCRRFGLMLLFAQQQKVKPKRLIGRLYEEGGFKRINKLMRVSNPDLFTRKKSGKKRISFSARQRATRRHQREQRKLDAQFNPPME